MSKQFGGKLTQNWKSVYSNSPNWKEGKFNNLVATQTGVDWKKLPGMLCKQFKGRKDGSPKSPLPIAKFNKEEFLRPSTEAKFIWYGHSVLLLRIANKTLLIDPMLGPDASPISPTKTKRFSEHGLELIHELPEIDLVLISHDHYDHLDLESIKLLIPKTKEFYVALGVKRHLLRWGVEEELITEFDWWNEKPLANINITFTPTRHFSGRGLSSISKCLWGGWALKHDTQNIWFSGDGGYGNHFKEIGDKLGPFDIAFMECGQYNDDWKDIHMFPNESVKAAIEAKVSKAMPVHWGGFNLSYQHAWYEPTEEFVQSAKNKSLAYSLPKIGEIFSPSDDLKENWWKPYK